MRDLLCQPTSKKMVGQREVVKRRRKPGFLFPFAFVFMMVTLLTACGGETGNSPAITSFEASSEVIMEGDSAQLTAIFSNGSGSIDNGVGAVASGVPKTVSPEETTTYTLTVTNNKLLQIFTKVTITVEPKSISPPEIASFAASAMTIVEGDSAELTPIFSNGSGSIDNGVGAVASGESKTISPTETTTFTLTVTNSEGVEAIGTVTVVVEPKSIAPPKIDSFNASAVDIMEGDSTELTAIFSNGSGSIDNGVGAVNSGERKVVSPAKTTTFMLTVTNSEGVEVTSTVTVAVEPYPITLTIASPSPNQVLNSDMEIAAMIESELDIATITATICDESISLVYSDEAVCSRIDCNPGFIGQIPLDGLAPGHHVLTVTAVDIEGRSISEQREIMLDRKPVLTINEPLHLTVASPNLPLDISCSDDIGNCEITVIKEGTASSDRVLLTSAMDSLSGVLDLSAYDGHEFRLRIEGRDSSNQTAYDVRPVFVEASESLERVKNYTGSVIDFDGQRALILFSGTNGDSLEIQDINSNASTVVDVPSGLTVSPRYSYLTPTGAIYEASRGNLAGRLYDWNNSVLHDLGHVLWNSIWIAGDYAIWNEGHILWLRQFSEETNTRVITPVGSRGAASSGNVVAANGVVTYFTSRNSAVGKYDTGIATTLADDKKISYSYPRSDGTEFVYRKRYPDRLYAIAYHDGVNETILVSDSGREPIAGRDYQINKGWVAFTKLGGLGHQVWTKDPTGMLLQRTFFGSDSYIDAVSADGEVVLVNSDRRYLSNAAGELTEVASTLGSTFDIDGVWYITIGRSVFKLE